MFSINEKIVNISCSVGQSLCQKYSTLLSFSYSVKAAIGDALENEHGCVSMKHCSQERQGAGFGPQAKVDDPFICYQRWSKKYSTVYYNLLDL